MYLESKSAVPDPSVNVLKGTKVLYSTVNLIDLAGSESAEAHKNPKIGPAKFEMQNINRSLLTLAAVISKLSEKSSQWIPYRDSKLTKYLENALQGNAKISIICNISPGESFYEQSQSTLNFATMAKKIKQTAQRNESSEGDKTMIITRLEAEIVTLKTRLQSLEHPASPQPLPSPAQAAQSELSLVKSKITSLESKIASSSSTRIEESGETTPGGKDPLPITFPVRVSQILETRKQQVSSHARVVNRT